MNKKSNIQKRRRATVGSPNLGVNSKFTNSIEYIFPPLLTLSVMGGYNGFLRHIWFSVRFYLKTLDKKMLTFHSIFHTKKLSLL